MDHVSFVLLVALSLVQVLFLRDSLGAHPICPGQARTEGEGEPATCRHARAADGKLGQNARRHSLAS